VPDDQLCAQPIGFGGGDTISVAAGTYTTSAELNITKDITISGAGAASTIVQAAASAGIADHRLFKDSGVTVTLQNMTIRYGVEASGGGINNASGTLTLNNVIISDNQVKDTTGNGLNGGGISTNGGSVTINNSAIINNSVTTSDVLTSRGNGGGIFIGSGTVNLNNTTISGNSAKRGGGGLYANGGRSTSATAQLPTTPATTIAMQMATAAASTAMPAPST
jgi:predicted outer membrane repeat protein